jgi:hypothetical protein
MMDKQKLRRADFITSIILVLFGVWMLSESLQMPMRDSFGGVQNVWYVSPALLPLMIGILIILLGVTLLVHSAILGGAKSFLQILRKRPQRPSEGTIRLLAVLVAILSFVYLQIPRIDFFLSVSLFLLFFISIFYLDSEDLFYRLALFYLIGNVVVLVLLVVGADRILGRVLPFSTDWIALIFWLSYVVYVGLYTRTEPKLKRRFRTTLIVSLIVPVMLCPVFRYLLLVPLPKEGAIVEIMHLVRYSF